jgi:hypothetical protein
VEEETGKRGMRGGGAEGSKRVWMRGDGRAEAAVFAEHSGFIFIFPFPSPICALHEADRLDQRAGEGEGERERDKFY